MYAQKIIKARLDGAQEYLDKLGKTQRFSLQLHPREYSLQFEAHLKTLYDPSARGFIRPLTPQESQFIHNEQIVCRSHFLYWTRYAHIKSKLTDQAEVIIRFPINSAQLYVHSVWAEMEEEMIAILVMQLKARQLGSSTLTELAIAHRTQFYRNINALVASSDPEKSRKMARMITLCWEHEPPWLMPNIKLYKSGELLADIPELNSTITVQHGTALSGIARGDTPDIFHVSEIPDFNDPAEDIDASLIRAVHESPDTFGVLESTAKGQSGRGLWWYVTYKTSKKNWPRRRSKLRPLFLPYFTDAGLYPTKTWLRKHPVPKDWKIPKDVKDHAKKCEQSIRENADLRKILGADWKMPIEKQWWWYVEREEAKDKGELSQFLEECCSNDVEAFQLSGRPVVPPEVIERLYNRARPLADYHGKPAVFGIIGPGITTEFEPDPRYIDHDRPAIQIKAHWNEDERPKLFYLIPLHHNPDLWENRFFVWEFPKPQTEVYATGIDCSEGIGLDNSVIEVIRAGRTSGETNTVIRGAEQVAEYAYQFISAAELTPQALAIGTWYSYISDENFNPCRQVIEIEAGGHGLQHQLRLLGWPVDAFHKWEGSYDSLNKRSSRKLGWTTNMWTRPHLIDDTLAAIKDGYFKVNSLWLIAELATLQKGDDNKKIEAKDQDHDDRFMAASMGFFSRQVWRVRERPSGPMIEMVEEEPNSDVFIAVSNQSYDQPTGYLYNNTLPFPGE